MKNEQQAKIQLLLKESLKSLNKRTQVVVDKRFGLKNGKTETLESIGKAYGITRERVRQIEEAGLRELRKNFLHSNLVSALNPISKTLAEHGGILRQDNLFGLFNNFQKYNSDNAYLVLAMTISPDYSKFEETDSTYPFWALKGSDQSQTAKNTISQLVSYLEKNKSLIKTEELYNLYKTKVCSSSPLPEKAFASYVSLAKNFGTNSFNDFGLKKWPEISPRGVKDEAYLVLMKQSKPTHFSNIASLISSAGFKKKKVNVQTVHNELIKDSRFVLVGRGLYALKDWGYQGGTVKDVLVELLKKEGSLSKDQIVAKTLSGKMVKTNTVLINLQNKKVFEKDESGNYKLKEA